MRVRGVALVLPVLFFTGCVPVRPSPAPNLLDPAPRPPRTLGPQWSRDEQGYHRKIEVKASRHEGGNVTGYTLPLEKGEAFVHEVDDDQGLTVGVRASDQSNPYATLEVEKDERGRPARYVVDLGEVRYFDLNGDGMIDALCDIRRRWMILFEGRFIEVEDSKCGPCRGTARSVGRETEYHFEGDRWKAR